MKCKEYEKDSYTCNHEKDADGSCGSLWIDNTHYLNWTGGDGSMTVWTAGHGAGADEVPETPSMILTLAKISEITS